MNEMTLRLVIHSMIWICDSTDPADVDHNRDRVQVLIEWE